MGALAKVGECGKEDPETRKKEKRERRKTCYKKAKKTALRASQCKFQDSVFREKNPPPGQRPERTDNKGIWSKRNDLQQTI